MSREGCIWLIVILTGLVPMNVYQGTLEVFLCGKYLLVVDAGNGVCGKNV